MLETLRLVRPEWYSVRGPVLAVLSWEDEPVRPAPCHGDGHLGVTWPERPKRPTVTFATAPLAEAEARSSVARAAGGRAALLFGHRPDKPGAFLRIPAGPGHASRP
jgi:hypothetical protein